MVCGPRGGAAGERTGPAASRSPHAPTDAENLVMACDVEPGGPRARWRWRRARMTSGCASIDRGVPVDVLRAVVDGEVVSRPWRERRRTSGRHQGPDGTRWVGLSAVRVAEDAHSHGHARTLCTALLSWGAEPGATRAYAQVVDDNSSAPQAFRVDGLYAPSPLTLCTSRHHSEWWWFQRTLVSSINAADAHRSTRCSAYTSAMFSETRYALQRGLARRLSRVA